MTETPSPETLARAHELVLNLHSSRDEDWPTLIEDFAAAISQPLQQQIETLETLITKQDAVIQRLNADIATLIQRNQVNG